MPHSKATIPTKLLQDSGLSQGLSQKLVERVYGIIITKNSRGELAVALAHERIKGGSYGKGYSWVSGHVDEKDRKDIKASVLREIEEETGIKPEASDFLDKISVRTEKSGKAIPTFYYYDQKGAFSNLKAYKGDGEKNGWILYPLRQFVEGLEEYKTALYGLGTNLDDVRLYFNDGKIQDKDASFSLRNDRVEGSIDVTELRVSKHFDKGLACALGPAKCLQEVIERVNTAEKAAAEAKKKAEAEAAAKKRAEEAEAASKKRAEEEAAKKRAEAEAAAKKKSEEEAAKKRAEEAETAAKKKAEAEEEAAKKKAKVSADVEKALSKYRSPDEMEKLYNKQTSDLVKAIMRASIDAKKAAAAAAESSTAAVCSTSAASELKDTTATTKVKAPKLVITKFKADFADLMHKSIDSFMGQVGHEMDKFFENFEATLIKASHTFNADV